MIEATSPPNSGDTSAALILVEGESDAEAVRALAERRGIDLGERRVRVLSAGGVTNFGRVLRSVRQEQGQDNVRIAGLFDQGAERHVARALSSAGVNVDPAAPALGQAGFFVCVADLEDELIRALGVDAVLDLLRQQGELRAFETLGKQPQHTGRPVDQQLRRFMGTRSMRKIRYGRLLVEALDLGRVPDPLDRVLDAVVTT